MVGEKQETREQAWTEFYVNLAEKAELKIGEGGSCKCFTVPAL
jgi:hypothetical protein